MFPAVALLNMRFLCETFRERYAITAGPSGRRSTALHTGACGADDDIAALNGAADGLELVRDEVGHRFAQPPHLGSERGLYVAARSDGCQ